MKTTLTFLLPTILTMGLAVSVYAHEESEQKSTDATANCEAMKTMDTSKMKADDPVMLAMMKKCQAEHKQMDSHADHGQHEGTAATKKDADHEHQETSTHDH